MRARDLRRAFVSVRRTYFPRWDRAGEWTVAPGPRGTVAPGVATTEHGYCDMERQRIHVARSP